MITHVGRKIHPLTLKRAYRITDANLAELLEISDRNVRFYTQGVRNPSAQTQLLCGLLHEKFQNEGRPCDHSAIRFEN